MEGFSWARGHDSAPLRGDRGPPERETDGKIRQNEWVRSGLEARLVTEQECGKNDTNKQPTPHSAYFTPSFSLPSLFSLCAL